MRLWSLHPKYLDRQGLLALWREGLLAQKVLAGKTVGYKHHPQLARFRRVKDPLAAIGAYLLEFALEASRRNYNFNSSKIIKRPRRPSRLDVTRGQVEFETRHLLKKLKVRDKQSFARWSAVKRFGCHPIFRVTAGNVESWEKT